MSGNEPTIKNKVSPHIQTQLPEFVQQDHPLFSTFLKHYYEFLEAGELVITGSNDYVIEETISKNFILDETEEKIVLEESVGKFTVGETITGAISGATARILVDDFDDNNRLFITSQQKFQTGETITGGTSGATSTVSSYRANPVQTSNNFLHMLTLTILFMISLTSSKIHLCSPSPILLQMDYQKKTSKGIEICTLKGY